MNMEVNDVVTVIVTMGRQTELGRLLEALSSQSHSVKATIVIDNEDSPITRRIVQNFDNTLYLNAVRNLGGAGGFAYGILSALAMGAGAVWLMDDDGLPGAVDCLSKLHALMVSGVYDMVSPLVLDIADPTQLAFFYYRHGRPLKERRALKAGERFEQFAHLFNGALVRADAFAQFGIPRYELFFRGDEVDFMHRLRRGGAKFVTTTDVTFLHPSGARDTVPIMGRRFYAVMPANPATRFYFYRNRGNLYREFSLIRSIAQDAVRYSWLFLITRRGDVAGLWAWASAAALGWMHRFPSYEQHGTIAERRAKGPAIENRDPLQ